MKALYISLAVVLLSAYAVVGQPVDPMCYVLNTLGEDVSRINLESGHVDASVMTVGSIPFSAPNQIYIVDTLAYVVMSSSDEIEIKDLSDFSSSGFIDFPPGSNPYWMVMYDSQYAFVTATVTDQLHKVDMINRTIVDTDSIGGAPEGVCIVDHKAYVCCTAFDWVSFSGWDQGKVAIWDIRGDSLIGRLDVGTNPQYCAVDDDDRVHVICTGDYAGTLGISYVIDTETDLVIDSVPLGGAPGQVTVGPENTVYTAAAGWDSTGFVLSYKASSLEIFHDIANPLLVDTNCLAIEAFADSTVVTGSFVDFINVIDSGGSKHGRYAVGDGPVHLDFNYRPGDINKDFNIDSGDLGLMVSFLFQDLPFTRPRWTANVTGDLFYDSSDLGLLVSFLFSPPGTVHLKPGPRWLMHNTP